MNLGALYTNTDSYRRRRSSGPHFRRRRRLRRRRILALTHTIEGGPGLRVAAVLRGHPTP